jgi:hypothetical protein
VNNTLQLSQCIQSNNDIQNNPQDHPNEQPLNCAVIVEQRGQQCNGWENLDSTSTSDILSVVPAAVYSQVYDAISKQPGVCFRAHSLVNVHS